MDNGAENYRRFLDGDDKGFEELVGSFKDGLILFLNGYAGNILLAEELAEDTFFRLLIKKPRFSGKSSFRSWLYAIGRNIAVDQLRRNRRAPEMSLDELEDCLKDETDLERAYIMQEDKLTVHGALKKLPDDYRHILWLIYFEGFTNREAETALGKNSRQISNLLYRAKQSLRSELEKEGFDYEDYR